MGTVLRIKLAHPCKVLSLVLGTHSGPCEYSLVTLRREENIELKGDEIGVENKKKPVEAMEEQEERRQGCSVRGWGSL